MTVTTTIHITDKKKVEKLKKYFNKENIKEENREYQKREYTSYN